MRGSEDDSGDKLDLRSGHSCLTQGCLGDGPREAPGRPSPQATACETNGQSSCAEGEGNGAGKRKDRPSPLPPIKPALGEVI